MGSILNSSKTKSYRCRECHAKYKQKNECRKIMIFDFVQSLIQAGFEVLVTLPSFKVLLEVLGSNNFA